MTPNEHEGTVAVDAAARWLYAQFRTTGGAEFDELGPMVQRQYREQVLGPVWAALEALPDRAASTLARVGSYLTDDMWCHHDGCSVSHDPCACGLDQLLDQLDQEPPR